MKKYLVKIIYNQETESDDYIVQYKTTSKSTPRGGRYIFLETEDDLEHPVVEEIDGELGLFEDPVKLKESLVAARYHLMVDDVYTEMKNVFGTDNDVSASAFAATWEAMLKRPAGYVDAELGLNSIAEVEAYAAAKIASSDAYGVYRLKRISQYQVEKASIMAGT